LEKNSAVSEEFELVKPSRTTLEGIEGVLRVFRIKDQNERGFEAREDSVQEINLR
jgi:hypothetical protein